MYRLRFFDDYGSGWLWPGDEVTRQAFDVGPLEAVLAHRLSPATRAEAETLSALHARTLNWDEPQTPLPLSAAFCRDFNARSAALLRQMQAEIGADFTLADERMILTP